jgi:hypothetical protein
MRTSKLISLREHLIGPRCMVPALWLMATYLEQMVAWKIGYLKDKGDKTGYQGMHASHLAFPVCCSVWSAPDADMMAARQQLKIHALEAEFW